VTLLPRSSENACHKCLPADGRAHAVASGDGDLRYIGLGAIKPPMGPVSRQPQTHL
jgi:hypothetical protein